MKNHGNGWLTSTKTQVWTEEKTLWGRVLVETAVRLEKKDCHCLKNYKVLITACNSSFSTTDFSLCKQKIWIAHACAGKCTQRPFWLFLCFSMIAYTILYRGHNNTTSIINLFSCSHEKALSPWYFTSFVHQLPFEAKDDTLWWHKIIIYCVHTGQIWE